MSKVDVYQSVTDRVIAALEEAEAKGEVPPWRKPWVGGGPMNVNTGRLYRGINVFLLSMAPFGDPRWGTFNAMKEAAAKHATEEGREIVVETTMRKGYPHKTYFEVVGHKKELLPGGVRKGEKGTWIVLWKRVEKKHPELQAGEQTLDNGYWFMRMFCVFNAEQVDGLPPYELPFKNEPIERAQALVDGYPMVVEHGGSRAFYDCLKDYVRIPEMGQFEQVEAYYATLYHELIHSTGHESRLKRIEPALFGSDPYAKEELVAEMGSAMLCGLIGIENLDQSAGYVGNWLSRLRDDHKLVVSAASQAQKAADLITGTKFENEPSNGS